MSESTDPAAELETGAETVYDGAPASAPKGFVFAATGDICVTLARRAARSLRLVHPGAEIDLFTDVRVDDSVFNQVHRLSESWFRPKMEAVLKSRFERTIFWTLT